MPKSALPTTSSLNLGTLQRLEKKLKKTTTTSSTALTRTPTSELSGNDGSLTRTEPNKRAFDNFEQAIGGRDIFAESLAFAQLEGKQELFLRLLCDPARQKDNLATIARDAGLLPSAVLELFRTASAARASITAMGHLYERIPAIMQDLTSKAVDSTIVCPDCQGVDNNPDSPESCMTCRGKGTILRASDYDRQKTSLEIAGLIKKGGGVNVNVQQNNVSGQPGAFFSRWTKTSDAAAYEVDAVDAKIVGEDS